MAGFTSPENIGVNAAAVVWLLPLAASIAVVYKATKVSKITARFGFECAWLFGSIVLFIAGAALVLLLFARLTAL